MFVSGRIRQLTDVRSFTPLRSPALLRLCGFLLGLGTTVLAGGCRLADATASPVPIRLERIDTNERIVTDAKIDGKPVRLAIDTGTGYPFLLMHRAAERLRLPALPPPNPMPESEPGHIIPQFTRLTTVEVLGTTLNEVKVGVFRPPADNRDFELDGLVGWPAVNENLWLFQLNHTEAPLVPLTEMPTIPGAVELHVEPEDVLVLTFSDPSLPKLVIDTGNADGIGLAPARWAEWKAGHAKAPRTVQSTYMPSDGIKVEELYWADEFEMGALKLRDVPVSRAADGYLHHEDANRDIVVLGLAALKRLFLAVDGKAMRALVVPDPNPAPPFAHNRLGVAFSRGTGTQIQALVATVAPGSPAAENDVRSGDVLVAVDGRSAEDWWRDSQATFSVPAGTRIELTLARGTEVLRRTLTARNLIGPAAETPKS